jgi:hypothetical protein
MGSEEMTPEDIENISSAIVGKLGNRTIPASIPAHVGAWISEASQYAGPKQWRHAVPIGPGLLVMVTPAPDGSITLQLADVNNSIFWAGTLRPAHYPMPICGREVYPDHPEWGSHPCNQKPGHLAPCARFDAVPPGGSAIERAAAAAVSGHPGGIHVRERFAASGPGWWPPTEAPEPGDARFAPPYNRHAEGTSYCDSLPKHGAELHTDDGIARCLQPDAHPDGDRLGAGVPHFCPISDHHEGGRQAAADPTNPPPAAPAASTAGSSDDARAAGPLRFREDSEPGEGDLTRAPADPELHH